MTIDETLLARLRDGDDLSARMEAASGLETLIKQNEEQARRIDRLEKLLRPLAEAKVANTVACSDNCHALGVTGLTLGDIRAARKAINDILEPTP